MSCKICEAKWLAENPGWDGADVQWCEHQGPLPTIEELRQRSKDLGLTEDEFEHFRKQLRGGASASPLLVVYSEDHRMYCARCGQLAELEDAPGEVLKAHRVGSEADAPWCSERMPA